MKISFSGTHGTGKTTSAYKLAYKMKISNPGKTVGLYLSQNRDCPYGFNKKASKQAQLWIFATQLKNELDLATKFDILITDRTVYDPIAYAYYFGYIDLANDLLSCSLHHVNSYNKIILKTVANNDFLVKEGNDRDVEDLNYRLLVENNLRRIYSYLKHLIKDFNYEEI